MPYLGGLTPGARADLHRLLSDVISAPKRLKGETDEEYRQWTKLTRQCLNHTTSIIRSVTDDQASSALYRVDVPAPILPNKGTRSYCPPASIAKCLDCDCLFQRRSIKRVRCMACAVRLQFENSSRVSKKDEEEKMQAMEAYDERPSAIRYRAEVQAASDILRNKG